MTQIEFAEKVNKIAPGHEEEVDQLCLLWLKQYAKEGGSDGKIAIKLLTIVEELLSI